MHYEACIPFTCNTRTHECQWGPADAEAHLSIRNTFRYPCPEGPVPYEDLTLVTLRAHFHLQTPHWIFHGPPIDRRIFLFYFNINTVKVTFVLYLNIVQGVHVKVRTLTLVVNSSLTVRPMALGDLSLERADNFRSNRPQVNQLSR